MVKLQDGSMVSATELLNGSAEDAEGNQLKFTEVKGATYPTFEAKSKLKDGTNRMRTYTFSLDDTLVRVSMGQTEEKTAATAETQKSVKEVSPSSSTTDTKKNSFGSSSSSNEDYRVKKHF